MGIDIVVENTFLGIFGAVAIISIIFMILLLIGGLFK